MRKLATIRRIDKLEPIPGADLIWKATIGGWELVTAKDNGFKEGDLIVYLEIDSWVPHEIAPFLSKGQEPREFNGVKGERLRTIKLRGQISQGLILPIEVAYDKDPADYDHVFLEGDDVTELLGIQKWEKPIPAQLSGKARGNFPSFISKTDQERCQNLQKEIFADNINAEYEVTVKLDGSSMTVYCFNEYEFGVPAPTLVESKVGVCSRNLDLQLDQEGNSFVDLAKTENILTGLQQYCIENYRSLALQGELCGPGIQGNKDGLSQNRFYVFDVYDIMKGQYLGPIERLEMVKTLQEWKVGIEHVPLIGSGSLPFFHEKGSLESLDVKGLLKMAEGKSYFGITQSEREGLVFKSMDGQFSFKAISNKFLGKYTEE